MEIGIFGFEYGFFFEKFGELFFSNGDKWRSVFLVSNVGFFFFLKDFVNSFFFPTKLINLWTNRYIFLYFFFYRRFFSQDLANGDRYF